MRRLVVIFTLFLVRASSGASDDWQLPPDLDAEPLAAEQGKECEGVGVGGRVCSHNCEKVLLCRGEAAEPIEIATCQSPLSCYQGECSDDASDCTPHNVSMTCTGRGLFPDPYDCTVYHICRKEDDRSTARYCDDGWAFDPLTSVCSKQTTDSYCTDFLPILCTNLAQNGIFPDNPSIYYICASNDGIEYYPQVHRCPHGGVYNATSFTCSEGPPSSPTSSSTTTSSSASSPSSASPGTPSTTSSSTSASTSAATPSTSSSTPPTSPPTSTPSSTSPSSTAAPPSAGAACPSPLDVVPDPADCYGYYECLPTYTWLHVDCIAGYYYNRESEMCVYGTCPYTLR